MEKQRGSHEPLTPSLPCDLQFTSHRSIPEPSGMGCLETITRPDLKVREMCASALKVTLLVTMVSMEQSRGSRTPGTVKD